MNHPFDTDAVASPDITDAFGRVRAEVLSAFYESHPTLATYLGVHGHDARLEDYSREAQIDAASVARGFERRLRALPAEQLSFADQIEHEHLLRVTEAAQLKAEVLRPWATTPDHYSSGLTNTAYVMVKREFAPAEDRLALLVERMRGMPTALAHARRNLDRPPQVYTRIAIDQLDGNLAFFEDAVPKAFAGVGSAALQRELAATNTRVMAALADFKTWLQSDLLPESNGEFVLGAETYRRRLWTEEMIDTPLDDLLAMAEADLARNQAAFVETARRINRHVSPLEVLAEVERHRPAAADLLTTTQGELDALARFLAERQLATVPDAVPVIVKETPPFLRATTSASIEVPGPFETVATGAYFNLTLPAPGWSQPRIDDFMRQWYYAAITNVAVHEVWPGHHLQFLRARALASDVAKVFGVASNVEGWAHYAEHLVIEQGFHGDDPRYQLAQLQDALLRDVRFIVGLRMHTTGLSMADAERLFLDEGWQTPHVSKLEALRGTFDATYGYYTLGKLLVLKLRDEYQQWRGSSYTLRGFHDAFLEAGPVPLALVRRIMSRGANRTQVPMGGQPQPVA